MDSAIRNFYKNKSIFITGGSGLVGLLTIEKLLRCTEVRRIYVLIRSKKGQSCEQRIENISKDELFTTLRKIKPDFASRIIGIPGECGITRLGISEGDRLKLCQSVNIVIHSAAAVNMKLKLSESMAANVGATQDILDLCHDMEFLQAFVYVSTAYSNCNRDDIDEIVYEPLRTADELYSMDEDTLNSSAVVKEANFPNVYAFTKNLAEYVIKTKAADLPTVIFRPSLITPTYADPVPGYINNLHSITGLHYLQNIGIWKVLYADPEIPLQAVPADKCISIMLASAWEVAKNRTQKLRIYNFASVRENTITGGRYLKTALKANRKFPSLKATRHISNYEISQNRLRFKILKFYYHTMPAAIMDALLLVIGRKPQLRDAYKKIDLIQSTLTLFFFKRMHWNYDNSKCLWNKMSTGDKEWLNFDLTGINWDEYIVNISAGLRTYVMKDDPKTLPKAHAMQRRLRLVQYGAVGVTGLIAFLLGYCLRMLWFISQLAACKARMVTRQYIQRIRPYVSRVS